MKMTDKRANKILGRLIDFLRKEGVEIDSPYDLENFMEDHACHSKQFETGRFKHLEDEDDS